MKFLRKKWLFILLGIFIFGILIGWLLELGGILNYGVGSPDMESLETRLWPFKFWEYIY
jgi:hypothetical protein